MDDIIHIRIDKTDWQFLEKEDSRTCEIINIKTGEKGFGFITNFSTTGLYTIQTTDKPFEEAKKDKHIVKKK